MQKIADGHAYAVPATIDDPKFLDEITEPKSYTRFTNHSDS